MIHATKTLTSYLYTEGLLIVLQFLYRPIVIFCIFLEWW